MLFNSSNDKKSLIENFLSLSLLQGINMILPLITFPYLVRVLGIDNFGLVNFSLSIIGYFNILVSFGFELSATKDISLNRENKQKLSEIFSSVTIIKIGMFIFSIAILSILILFIDSMNENSMLYYATFGIVLGNVLFPSWFFQGVEKMKYITIITAITRSLFAIFIFILVQSEDDFIFVPLLNSIGAIIGGIIAIYIIFKTYKIRFYIPKKNIILKQLKDSFYYFISRIANNGSRYFATTIIGAYFGNTIVGYYALVEKLFYAFTSIGGLVSQTIYPYMSRTKDLKFFKKILLLSVIITVPMLLILIYFNEPFLMMVFAVKNEMASNIFSIVFSGALFSIVSSIIGYPFLAAFGYPKYANNSLIYASLLYVVYILIAVTVSKNIYYVSFSIVVYMITALLIRLYYIKKTSLLKGISINNE
jgi:polysaccharide transporter, PST family